MIKNILPLEIPSFLIRGMNLVATAAKYHLQVVIQTANKVENMASLCQTWVLSHCQHCLKLSTLQPQSTQDIASTYCSYFITSQPGKTVTKAICQSWKYTAGR